MSDIFLSYASADRERARQLADALAARGWSVWWDRTIPPGRNFDDVIEEALDSARCVIVLWSAASVASQWVKTEAAEAARREVLVPALLEPVKIPLEFRRLQAADLSGWPHRQADAQFDQLVDSIRRRIAPQAPETSTPVAPRVDERLTAGRRNRAWWGVTIAAVLAAGAIGALWSRAAREASVRSSDTVGQTSALASPTPTIVEPAPRPPAPTPAPTPTPTPAPTRTPRNQITNFRAVDISDAELRIAVDYIYTGEFGPRLTLTARLRSDGNPVSHGFFHQRKPLVAGGRSETFTITRDLSDPSVITTTEVAVCFVVPPRVGEPFCETFPYRKTWRGTASPESRSPVDRPTRPRPGNRIANFRAEDVSPTELRVTVDYYYAGDLEGGASLHLVVSPQRGGENLRGFTFDNRSIVQIGLGTATLGIKKILPELPLVTTTDVEVCFASRARGKQFCQTFPHTKEWRGFQPVGRRQD